MNLTQREISLCKAALDYLHSLDGGQAIELEIHAAILRDPAVHPKPSATEVETVIKICDVKKWTIGVPSKFAGKMKWSISDAGEAARLEMV
ncbi:MAG TPA: hypothetical protein VNN22_24245 [Verrucomicrobiae bacterium]|nr:hypothetical protein [Verrucomicrobiae bacterium]